MISRKAVVKSVPTARLTILLVSVLLEFLKITLAKKRLAIPPAKDTAIIQNKAIGPPKKIFHIIS
jgi:hypothetical protein